MISCHVTSPSRGGDYTGFVLQDVGVLGVALLFFPATTTYQLLSTGRSPKFMENTS